jgi:hypothetical protein
MPFPSTSGGGSGTTLTSSALTQTAHGFTVGDAVYWTGSAYAKGQANSATTSEILGIVATVPTANTFTIATSGTITGLSGLTSGEVYWLSDATAGLATTTQPTAIGSVSKPLFVATSATTAQIQIFDTAPAQGQTAVVQYGENTGITNGGTFTTTLVDIAGSSFTLSPGTYNVDFIVTGSNATQNVGTVALYTSSDILVQGSQAQNSWVASDKVQLIGNATVIVSTTTTYKLKGQTNAGVFTVSNVPASFSSTAGVSKISWTQIGASPVPMDLVGEYGEQVSVTASTNIPAGTTSATPVNLIPFTLPSAGVWEVVYNLRTTSPSLGQTAPNNAGYVIGGVFLSADNSLVANSEGIAGFGHFGTAPVSSSFQTIDTVVQTVRITTTGATTYYVGAWNVGDETSFVISNTNGKSKITYKKISGFLPSSGQTVDYVSVRRITSNQTGIAINTDVIYNSISNGNIPYNTTTGVFTLTAGKTYNLFASAKIRNDGTGTTGRYVQFEWVDSVSNVALTGLKQGVSIMSTSALNESGTDNAGGIYTPVSNQTVKVRVTGADGSNIELDSNRTAATITQIGSSAVIAGIYPGTWTTYTPVITGTTTNPTIPTSGTITGSYSVNGKMLNLNMKFFAPTTTGGNAGSGSYIFSLPAGYVIDTTKANIPTAVSQTAGDGLDGGVVGSATARNAGSTAFGWVTPLTTTGVGIFDQSTAKLIGSATIAVNGSGNTTYAISAQIPIL